MWAQCRCPAGSTGIGVPRTSRSAVALPLRISKVQPDALRSDAPAGARLSAKNTRCPCRVATAPSSQRTGLRSRFVHGLRLGRLPPASACVLPHPSCEFTKTASSRTCKIVNANCDETRKFVGIKVHPPR